MIHVDLVLNDYHQSQQVVLGRVTSVGDLGVKIECDDSNLERALHEPLFDPRTQSQVTYTDNGDRFIDVLSRTWDGTYILATGAHEEAACPFAHVKTVPFQQYVKSDA